MALKKCKECGKDVSTKASLCPHCGAKQKRNSVGCGGAILIIIVIFITGVQISNYSQKAEQKKQTAHQEEIRRQENERIQNQKKAFEESIESHYTELLNFSKEQQIDNALAKVNLFKKFDRIDYKDVSKYYEIIHTQSLSENVKNLPASDIDGNLKIYKELLSLNPNNQLYKDKVVYYQKKWDQFIKEKEEREYRASCHLELTSSRWSKDYGYAIYEGQVKNISNLKLENVQAVVTWYDKNDNMITSSSALIEYNPILPGQSSPFKVIKTYNPAMEKASIEFTRLMGGTIKTYRKK
jgi:hypothetical protein